jgi:hypothetical protein
MNADPRERFDDLDREEFADLIASTWRHQGWTIRTRSAEGALPALPGPVSGELRLVGRSSQERLVLTLPAEDGEMTARELLELVSAISGPEKLTVVAAAGFTTGSLSVADAYGVDIVGPEALSRLTESLEKESGFHT